MRPTTRDLWAILTRTRGRRHGAPVSFATIKGDVISAKVFVGNLNFSTTQAELETLFATVGDVSEVFLPIDRATGQPRGFAFVEFSDASVIAEAISRFDGTELQGRMLKVNEARERAPRPPGGGFGGGADFGGDAARFKPAGKPKGSRRGVRGRKRGF